MVAFDNSSSYLVHTSTPALAGHQSGQMASVEQLYMSSELRLTHTLSFKRILVFYRWGCVLQKTDGAACRCSAVVKNTACPDSNGLRYPPVGLSSGVPMLAGIFKTCTDGFPRRFSGQAGFCSDECTAGTEPKFDGNRMVCTRCDGNQYGLGGGKCHQCPKSADCTGSNDGYDIVARAGYWRGQPFFNTCVDANTMRVLRESGAVFEVRGKNSPAAIEPARRRAPPSSGKTGKTSSKNTRTFAPTAPAPPGSSRTTDTASTSFAHCGTAL